MSFAHINEVAYRAGISTKSVYNYLAKHSDIQTEKRGGKTYVNREQFVSYFQHSPVAKENSNVTSPAANPVSSEEGKTASHPVQKTSKDSQLAQKLEQVENEKETLQKVNTNLESNLQKYALMLSDEKTEKQLWIDKYNETNEKYIGKIEESAQEKIRHSRVVYGLLGLLGMLLVAGVLVYYYTILLK